MRNIKNIDKIFQNILKHFKKILRTLGQILKICKINFSKYILTFKLLKIKKQFKKIKKNLEQNLINKFLKII